MEKLQLGIDFLVVIGRLNKINYLLFLVLFNIATQTKNLIMKILAIISIVTSLFISSCIQCNRTTTIIDNSNQKIEKLISYYDSTWHFNIKHPESWEKHNNQYTIVSFRSINYRIDSTMIEPFLNINVTKNENDLEHVCNIMIKDIEEHCNDFKKVSVSKIIIDKKNALKLEMTFLMKNIPVASNVYFFVNDNNVFSIEFYFNKGEIGKYQNMMDDIVKSFDFK